MLIICLRIVCQDDQFTPLTNILWQYILEQIYNQLRIHKQLNRTDHIKKENQFSQQKKIRKHKNIRSFILEF